MAEVVLDPGQRMRHVSLKVDRAREHLEALRQELGAFFARAPFGVAVKRDPDSRKIIYFLSRADPVPDRLSLVAGDVIQNLVTALDHLAYQLVGMSTGGAPPKPHAIYFPICRSAEQYEKEKHRKMLGATEEVFRLMDDTRPYRGGNDVLWVLQQLNNIEKHRLLVTVGAQAGGVHLGQMMAPLLKDAFPPEAVEAFRSMDLYVNPADKGFPLSPGFELLIGAPDEEPNPDQRFKFDVVLHEPDLAEGQAILPLLSGFLETVEGVVERFRPILEEAP